MKFYKFSALLALLVLHLSSLISNEACISTSSREFFWIDSYLSSVSLDEIPSETSKIILHIRNCLKNRGHITPTNDQLASRMRNAFPHSEVVAEVATIILHHQNQQYLSLISNIQEDEKDVEPSKHLEKAVENYMWGTAEIAIGIAEGLRGDPVGAALIVADGVRHCKEAWEELQEAAEENSNDNDEKNEN